MRGSKSPGRAYIPEYDTKKSRQTNAGLAKSESTGAELVSD